METTPHLHPGHRLSVALLEPFWGGSHRAVVEGWVRASRHRIEVFSLPARFWKWRMRGAAFRFASVLGPRLGEFDAVVATTLMDVAHLKALLPGRVPILAYFHENQVAYPLRPGEAPAARDLQYAFTDLASALAADGVGFNSAFQRDGFFGGLRSLLRRMPDARVPGAVDTVEAKAEVLPLGIDVASIPRDAAGSTGPPVVLWNHRWEYDKDPEAFFRVLRVLAEEGVAFRVVVVGESFGTVPEVFPLGRQWLGDRVMRWGYVSAVDEYRRLLARCDVVVSTARQENFGLSVLEAAAAGCHPLVPRRLAYPEVLPPGLHDACLYEGEADLVERLRGLLTGHIRRLKRGDVRREVAGYDWSIRGGALDEWVAQVSRAVASHPTKPRSVGSRSPQRRLPTA